MSLLLSSNAYSDDNNLVGIKEFNLIVSHNKCYDENYIDEITTNTK